ncbi:MAG: hypothetical protein ABSE73_15485 [Planctomycetota bacterium]
MNDCRDSLGIVVCLLAAALPGCFRYEETIEVDQNGAGTAAIVFSRPAAGTPQGTAEDAVIALSDAHFNAEAMKKGLPEGVTCAYTKSEAGGRVQVDVRYKFDSIHKLVAWAISSNSPFTNVSVASQGRLLEYSRTFRPLDPEQLSTLRAVLPNGELVFRFTGPGELRQTDAARREGRTAVWQFTAPELLSGRTIQAQYAWGLPWPLCLLGGAAVVLMAGLVVALWRRGRAGGQLRS